MTEAQLTLLKDYIRATAEVVVLQYLHRDSMNELMNQWQLEKSLDAALITKE